MENLLRETLAEINEYKLNIEDIIYIGTDPQYHGPYYSCTWEEYEKLADFEYDDGYGSAEIPIDLVIIFKDNSIMTREEYDGSERWSVRKSLPLPSDTKPIKRLGVGCYSLVANLQEK